MSIPEGYDCVCVECKSPFIYANRSRPSDRDVPLGFCSRRCCELAESTPAGMSEPAIDSLALYRRVCDIWAEANAADTVIGRPAVLMAKLTALRDELGSVRVGYVDPAPAVVPEPAAWRGFNHELKCWPGPFEAMQSGAKTAEFRRDDRGFEVGDILRLREWTPQRAEYTGRELYRRVTHMLGAEFGVPAGFVMLSLAAPAAVREPETGPGDRNG